MRRVRPTNLLRLVILLTCVLCVVVVLRHELDSAWRIIALAFAIVGPLALQQAVLLGASSSESPRSSRWVVDLDLQRLEAMRKMLSKGTKHDPPEA